MNLAKAGPLKDRTVSAAIGRHLGIALVLILGLLTGVAVLTLKTVATLGARADWVDPTNQVRLQLSRTLSTLTDAETGQRGYLLTQASDYLAPYTAAKERIDGDLAALQRLTIDHARQQQHVERL